VRYLPSGRDFAQIGRRLWTTIAGNGAAGWRIHICHFKEPGSQLFQLVNNVFCSDPAFRSLSDKATYRQWARTTQNKGREAGEIEEVTFIAHRAELRAGGSHGYELDRAKPVGQMHGKDSHQQKRGSLASERF
jgi:hypothetical protein